MPSGESRGAGVGFKSQHLLKTNRPWTNPRTDVGRPFFFLKKKKKKLLLL